MIKILTLTLLCMGLLAGMTSVSAAGKEGNIAHIVYFTLKDKSDEAKKKLVDACDKYLSGHDGTLYYGTGVIADDLSRDVNVKDWDVGLHIVFESKEAHDKYQTHKRHLQFIKENKDNWSKVRVFDSRITPAKKAEKK